MATISLFILCRPCNIVPITDAVFMLVQGANDMHGALTRPLNEIAVQIVIICPRIFGFAGRTHRA